MQSTCYLSLREGMERLQEVLPLWETELILGRQDSFEILPPAASQDIFHVKLYFHQSNNRFWDRHTLHWEAAQTHPNFCHPCTNSFQAPAKGSAQTLHICYSMQLSSSNENRVQEFQKHHSYSSFFQEATVTPATWTQKHKARIPHALFVSCASIRRKTQLILLRELIFPPETAVRWQVTWNKSYHYHRAFSN